MGDGAMRKPALAMLGLALVGLAVALYDSYVIYNGGLLWCPPPIDGCNEVAYSPFAKILGIPVGYFGVIFYLYMIGLAALLVFDPVSRALRSAAVAYAALGVGFSAYFVHLQVNFIHAFCVYCVISGITTVLLLVCALAQLRGRDSGRVGLARAAHA